MGFWGQNRFIWVCSCTSPNYFPKWYTFCSHQHCVQVAILHLSIAEIIVFKHKPNTCTILKRKGLLIKLKPCNYWVVWGLEQNLCLLLPLWKSSSVIAVFMPCSGKHPICTSSRVLTSGPEKGGQLSPSFYKWGKGDTGLAGIHTATKSQSPDANSRSSIPEATAPTTLLFGLMAESSCALSH